MSFFQYRELPERGVNQYDTMQKKQTKSCTSSKTVFMMVLTFLLPIIISANVLAAVYTFVIPACF